MTDSDLTPQQELDELNAIFELHNAAEQRGIEMWQKATGRDKTWPDVACLTAWLIDRLERAEAVIAAARMLGEPKFTTEEVTEMHGIALNVVCHIMAYDQENEETEF